jgi:hypothetical protein
MIVVMVFCVIEDIVCDGMSALYIAETMHKMIDVMLEEPYYSVSALRMLIL